jgi:hypothetical protein
MVFGVFSGLIAFADWFFLVGESFLCHFFEQSELVVFEKAVVDDGVDFLLGKMDQLEEGMLQIVLPDMVVAGLD